MRPSELREIRAEWMRNNHPYRMVQYDKFDYAVLEKIMYCGRAGRGDNDKYNDVIIMADTETSKKRDRTETYKDNHVVAFTVSIRAFHMNIVTLYGHRPSEFMKCISDILDHLKGDKTVIYFHNMAYDWTFARKFFMREFGIPVKQLNTKPHYPIYIEFDCGLILKDSLILAQRSLGKWAKDLDVEHKKLPGDDYWTYDKIRDQTSRFTAKNKAYIEGDTLAGVECIDVLMTALGKHIYSIPYTATGIPREEVRKRGKESGARDAFKRMCMSYEDYVFSLDVYHGGYTHANRHLIDVLINEAEYGTVKCFDFSSSYPYCLLTTKMPAEKFMKFEDNKSIDFILNNAEAYAFMFKLCLVKPKLKHYEIPMPALQFSKCIYSVNAIVDNGRVLEAEYLEICITEYDLMVIAEQYDLSGGHSCTDVRCARKEYLPRWFTDYVYELYQKKCTLKGGDPVLYALAKASLNSLYGMCVQRCIRDDITEDYDTGEYLPEQFADATEREEKNREKYEKYLKKYTSILPYQWGIWVTAASFYNLHTLGKCCELWAYSDTDSCYGIGWDMQKVEAYNEECRKKLRANGYEPVYVDGREFCPGVAESDGDNDEYTEFKVQGAKRYCGRNKADGELHITVAGVPKTGAACLKDDINNFTKLFVFDGETTGKLTHSYIFVDDIYIDANGNETGDSVDLTPCDYVLDSVALTGWDELFTEVYDVPVFDRLYEEVNK